MTTVLWQDEWATVTVDGAIGLVRYVRNETPYPDPESVERSYASLGETLARIPPGMKLLIDIRRAPPRNDEAFEKRANVALGVMARRFAKIATLVSTAVGALQSKRLARERSSSSNVHHDERSALASLGVG